MVSVFNELTSHAARKATPQEEGDISLYFVFFPEQFYEGNHRMHRRFGLLIELAQNQNPRFLGLRKRGLKAWYGRL